MYPASRSVDDLFRIANTKGAKYAEANASPATFSGDQVSPAEMTNIEMGQFSPEPMAKAPAVLTWCDLTVTAHVKGSPEPKMLINHINGSITGGLWAIMGPSGSGKTTFLGVLSKRLDNIKMPTTGTVHLNGKDYGKLELKSMSGYVMQDDLIHSHLTVQETLMFTARLRMHKDTTAEERSSRVEEVLKTMGISYCVDVIIGDTRTKGISGGERKRVCVGMELLMNPKLLFLDEPTSGLDSTTALSLCSTLKGMADSGQCTVVCTIHQPQTMIYDLMDNLILMKKGSIVYQGRADKALDYFGACGYPCPQRMNPADHFLNVICMDPSQEDKGKVPTKMEPPIDLDFGLDKDDFTIRAVPTWFAQFFTLFTRNLIEHSRRKEVFFMNLLVTTVVSIFISTGAWNLIGTHQDSIPKRNAILFFVVIHQGVVSSLQGTYSFPLERALMMRERSAGAYYVSAYFLAKTFADMLFQTPMPILFTCIVYPWVGLTFRPAHHFFVFMGICTLCSMSATSLANMTSCLCVSIQMSTVVLAFFMEVTRLYSGFFISPALLIQTPLYYRYKFADALSYMKYSYVGFCINEYKDLALYCSKEEMDKKLCKVTSGNAISQQFGYDQYSVDFCCGMLVIYVCVTRFISYLGLRFIKI
eukprot:gene6045-12187_t